MKTFKYETSYHLTTAKLQEDVINTECIHLHVKNLSHNIQQLVGYASKEILNNAIEHSNGNTMQVAVYMNAEKITITIIDDSLDIFNKIQINLGCPRLNNQYWNCARANLLQTLRSIVVKEFSSPFVVHENVRTPIESGSNYSTQCM